MTVALDTANLVTFASRTLRRVPGERPSIGTDRSDMLTVTAPPDLPEAAVARLVGHHYSAIATWCQRGSACDAWAPIARQLVNGEGFLHNGRSARFRRRADQAPGTAEFTRDGHGWWLHANPDDEPQTVLRAIVACYGTLTRERARRAAEQFAPRFGFRQTLDVRVHDRERDWVSTRLAKGVLKVEAHWALAQFTHSTVDYLVARALAARSDARFRLEAVVPCPEQPRRAFQREAPGVWTGELA